MHPRCRHIGACWDLLEWFQLFSTSQNTSRIQFRTFLEKKNQIFWFPCCSTREDLSVDVSITNVGLMLTMPGRFFFSAYGNKGYGQNSISSISNFFKKNSHISGFPWCSTREDLSIDVSITNVGLILTKLRWFQLFVKSQNSNFFEKKNNQIFGFPWCSTREDHSIDVSITNVGLILTKLRWFQLFVKIWISNFFEKKIKFLDFHGVVLVKTFALMYQLLM